MNPFWAITIFVCIGLSSFTTGIIAHEATHLAFSSEPTGVCFGKCQTSSSSLGWAVATASGKYTEENRREDIPIAVGLTATFATLTIGTKALFQVAA